MSEYTPTPWKIFTTPDGRKLVGIGAEDGQGILDCGFGVWAWDDAEGIANAKLVVKAVNNHEALINALRNARNYIDSIIINTPDKRKKKNFGECLRIIETALANAGASKEFSA